jgi:hypothetical protein
VNFVNLRAAALLTVVGALVAAAPAASLGSARTLTFRIAGDSWNLGVSDACPDGSVRYGIETRTGKRIGTSTVCVLSSRKTDGAGPAPKRIVQRVEETDAFRQGWLRSRLTYDFRYARGGKRATVELSGLVVGGTGRYAKARGTVQGSGPMAIDAKGEHPEIAVTVRFR